MTKILVCEVIGKDVERLMFSDGSAFYMRNHYLSSLPCCVSDQRIKVDEEFSDEEFQDLVNAGLAFACEKKALDYLERSEQFRAGLEKKLFEKSFDKSSINLALDYLEQRNFLNDERFAYAWIRNHEITKPQGRMRLETELSSRGVKKQAYKAAIEQFFTENDEEEVCKTCYEKIKRHKSDADKIFKALFDQGFTYKMINRVMKTSYSE